MTLVKVAGFERFFDRVGAPFLLLLGLTAAVAIAAVGG